MATRTTGVPQDTAALEIDAVGALAGNALAELTHAVRRAHEGVSTAIDAVLPPGWRHNRPTSAFSPGMRAAYRRAAAAAGRLPVEAAATVHRLGCGERLAPSNSAAGRTFLAFVNGLWPATVAELPALRVTMAVRVDHRDLPLTGDAVADAFPGATDHLVVFLHGMAMDEDCWQRPAASTDEPGAPAYGDHLRDALGVTPVYVRYATGRSVADNGADLAELVERLVSVWPTRVTRIRLVGHSMGGLVSIAAADRAAAAGLGWATVLRGVTTLGTPHHGASLARLLHRTNNALDAAPIVGPLWGWGRIRSPGGSDLLLDTHRYDDEPAPHEWTVSVVSATRRGAPSGRVRRWVGDGLVPVDSAEGVRVSRFALSRLHVNDAGHLGLLNHPAVRALLERQVEGDRRPGGERE